MVSCAVRISAERILNFVQDRFHPVMTRQDTIKLRKSILKELEVLELDTREEMN